MLDAAAAHGLTVHLSVEEGQEFLFHRLRRIDRARAVREFGLLDPLVVWHLFDTEILRAGRDLIARGHVRGRDAVHAATALAAGCDAIVSCDRDVGGIPGLRRIDPADGPVG